MFGSHYAVTIRRRWWQPQVGLCQRLRTDCWGLMMWKLFLVAVLTLAAAGCAAAPSRADLEALANGEQAIQDRSAAAEAADVELAAVRKLLPWSDWREHALDQTCVSESAGLHTQTYWVWCTTSLTTYAGFTGDLTAEILRTDETVMAAGWHDRGPYGAGPAIHDLQNGHPAPKTVYTDGEPTTCGPASWSLTQQWLAAGGRLLPGDGPPTPSTRDQALYWDVAPLDHEAVRANIMAQHQYVVIVSLSLTCTYPLDD